MRRLFRSNRWTAEPITAYLGRSRTVGNRDRALGFVGEGPT